MNGDGWTPLGAVLARRRPQVDEVFGHDHGVWRVDQVRDLLVRGKPAAAGPYRVHAELVGGLRPAWKPLDADPVDAVFAVWRAESYQGWHLYPGGRWPRCSCCGEPMPCRAALADAAVAAALSGMEDLNARLPGCCWHCKEPITLRQKSVTYDGDNLDLPGGPPVRFHTRSSCSFYAQRYELRWLVDDLRRERILTWPACLSTLIVHGDGSSECAGNLDSTPDCRGHLTHDHGAHSACYAYSGPRKCRRGCAREGHPGIRTTPRPPRTATQFAPMI